MDNTPSAKPRPRIIVPSFCKVHLHDFIVKRLEIPEDGRDDASWQRWLITGQLLLFNLAIRAERTQKLLQSGRELQEILSSQGCLACGHYRAYCFVARFLKAKGLEHGSQVAMGEIQDSEFTEWR